jgi:ATP adenylyltransferase
MKSYIPAPWREKYVRGLDREPKGCFFCRAAKGKDDAAAYVLHRGRYNFVLLNRYPYTIGHLLVAPYRHTADYARASKAGTDEMADLMKLGLRVLSRLYKPRGFNTGMNLGRSGGAGAADHYHSHVVCRWAGDSNFMPLVGGTRVFIEDLDTTYARLRPLFEAAGTGEYRRKAARG